MKLKNTSEDHKRKKRIIRYAIITVSDTRTMENDDAGTIIAELIQEQGHQARCRAIIKDDQERIRTAVEGLLDNPDVDAIITTGGTGLGTRDVTIEAVKTLFEKELPGFTTMFTTLSHEEIGATAIMSRATAGVAKKKAIFCIPGSPKACKLALEKLILKETGHILNHIRGDA